MLKFDLNLVWTIVNLLILYFLMKKFLFGRINAIIEKRQEEADEQFTIAGEKQKEAEGLKAQYEESMKTVEEEKAKAVTEARQKATAEYNRIVGEADEKAEGILKDAKNAAETEKTKILKSAQAEIADMVVNATAKVVGEKTPSQSDRDLYDEFLRKAGEQVD